MRTAELRGLAEGHGVTITTTLLGFSEGVMVEARYEGWLARVQHHDPDRAMVEAIERLVWQWSPDDPGPFAWAFDEFDEMGEFVLEDIGRCAA